MIHLLISLRNLIHISERLFVCFINLIFSWDSFRLFEFGIFLLWLWFSLNVYKFWALRGIFELWNSYLFICGYSSCFSNPASSCGEGWSWQWVAHLWEWNCLNCLDCFGFLSSHPHLPEVQTSAIWGSPNLPTDNLFSPPAPRSLLWQSHHILILVLLCWWASFLFSHAFIGLFPFKSTFSVISINLNEEEGDTYS